MDEPSVDDDAGAARRRSTWRDVPSAPASGPPNRDATADDAIADAIAAEFATVTSSIPIVTTTASGASARVSTEALYAALMDGEDAPEETRPAPEPAPEPEPEPGPDPRRAYLPSEPPRYLPGASEWRDLALAPEAESTPWAPPIAEPSPVAAAQEPPALVDPPLPPSRPAMPVPLGALLQAAPPPTPGTVAVPPPDAALPDPPRLRSLDDVALAHVLARAGERHGVAGAMAELETQMDLRQEDAREFASWERSIRAIGTQEALDTIAQIRAGLAGRLVLPDVDVPKPEADEPTTDVSVLREDHAPDMTSPPPAGQDSPPPEDPWAALQQLGSQSAWPRPPQRSEPLAEVQTDEHPVESVAREQTAATRSGFGRGAALVLPWFAVTSSTATVGIGATVFAMGLSLRQAFVAVLLGVLLSVMLLGVTTLAGTLSGQTTASVSRAAFGLVGNAVPAVITVLTRVVWSAILLWAAARLSASAFAFPDWLSVGVIAGVALVAILVSLRGRRPLMVVATVSGLASLVVVALIVALAMPSLDLTVGMRVDDGDWLAVIPASVTVFAVLGLAWAGSGSEFARGQRPEGSGAGAVLFTILGVAVPALVLLGVGIVLSSANPTSANTTSAVATLGHDPTGIAIVSAALPSWAALPVAVGGIVAILGGVAMLLHSGASALQSMSLGADRGTAARVVGVVVLGLLGAGLAVALSQQGWSLSGTVDVAVLLAVPTAAWAGILVGDLTLRRVRLTAAVLSDRGVLGAVNWISVGMLALATIVGFGLTDATLAPLAWQGYLWDALSVDPASAIARSDLGVLVALALGVITPIVAGIRRIRRQERALLAGAPR